ncbi:diaminobutyrate acetyltransferase [Niveispirillum cyanobacteriorum]|uniref:L-2,4-diaminobutyric acid acetyltransferase n=1 Tax=Niveispirillum cyanobacteriorum TaxID=1612173 RepID=A0A2K9ND65_9PROT|nr:diaminobutyrate acetyltransferase [Niveispirillum cyanobacteriorum]AUN31058.1 diaminobutyrate acetyltransferase [Niveispirillum cyanobacteriorum]GGE84128.1 L-2,4-diaminobutyric acid acetyltransferase [Niveispirillum cyanobacteriorum]
MALPAHQPAAKGFPHGPVAFSLRKPQAADGAAIHRLIAACPPLDVNSLYCNLLQASHFADCCILAEGAGLVVGWISGYRLPVDPRTLFVWQVAVDPAVRGQGLGQRLLTALLARPGLGDITAIATTITPSNRASWALFQGFADSQGAPLRHDTHFDRERHLAGTQESEHLVTIGPLPTMRAAA